MKGWNVLPRERMYRMATVWLPALLCCCCGEPTCDLATCRAYALHLRLHLRGHEAVNRLRRRLQVLHVLHLVRHRGRRGEEVLVPAARTAPTNVRDQRDLCSTAQREWCLQQQPRTRL